MIDRDRTTELVNGLLKFLLVGGVITTGMVVPNALVAFNKPMMFALKKLDANSREHELKRVLNYMKRRGFIDTASYEHGITITAKGRKRAKKVEFTELSIAHPQKWDRQWRIVFFDIPESKRNMRNTFIRKLRRLGFRPLQRSTWIHPFPCRTEMEIVTHAYGISRYVSYIETSFIDNQKALIVAFSRIL